MGPRDTELLRELGLGTPGGTRKLLSQSREDVLLDALDALLLVLCHDDNLSAQDLSGS